MTRRRRIILVTLLPLLSFYVAAYGYARHEHWLVHRSGFAYGMTANHDIAIGDLGLGWDSRTIPARISYVVFTPLRFVETAFWYMRHPAGRPWPYTPRP